MRKLVFMFAAMAVITMASCGQGAKGDASVNDSDSIAVVDSVDTVAVDSVVDYALAFPHKEISKLII